MPRKPSRAAAIRALDLLVAAIREEKDGKPGLVAEMRKIVRTHDAEKALRKAIYDYALGTTEHVRC